MWRQTQWLFGLLMLQAISCLDADFDGLISSLASDDSPIPDHIPKVAHFVYVTLKPVGWIDYAAIRSAYANLQAEKINIWAPKEGNFPGEMWERIFEIPGVVVRRVEMPDTVYGNKVKFEAHVSDLIRLKAVYSEGGECFEGNSVKF
jgi:hypothetical protein